MLVWLMPALPAQGLYVHKLNQLQIENIKLTPVVWKPYTCSDHEQKLFSCCYSLNNIATIYIAFIPYWALEVI